MGHHGLLYECLPWAPRCFSWSHSACLASAPHSNFYKSDHVILLLKTFQRLHITFKIKSRPHLKRSLCSGLCCLSRFLSFCACPCWLCTSGLSLFLDQVVFLSLGFCTGWTFSRTFLKLHWKSSWRGFPWLLRLTKKPQIPPPVITYLTTLPYFLWMVRCELSIFTCFSPTPECKLWVQRLFCSLLNSLRLIQYLTHGGTDTGGRSHPVALCTHAHFNRSISAFISWASV